MGNNVGPNGMLRTSFGDNAQVLPPEFVRDLFKEVQHESLALKLAGTTPMNINGVSTSTIVGRPVAGVVGEGEPKPIIKGGMKSKTWKPIKLAAIMYGSTEARLANPGGYFEQQIDLMKSAIARALDLAVFHGKNGLSNTVIPGVEYLAQTNNQIRLGSSPLENGGIRTDLVNGWGALAGKLVEPDGFAFDARLQPQFVSAVDKTGRPLFQDASMTNLKDGMGNLLGLPAVYDREAVSGYMGAVPDTYIRGFAGEFKDSLKIGYAEQMTIKRTDQATIVDGDKTIHLWQQNMEATLIECIVGWVIKDPQDFVKYTVAPDAYKAGVDYAKDSLVTDGGKEYRAKQDVKSASTNPKSDGTNWEAVV